MHKETGKIQSWNDIAPEERHNYVPVIRDLTRKERMEKQIRLYSPCACGSGKKFKFCCRALSDEGRKG